MEAQPKPSVPPKGPDVEHLKIPPDLLQQAHDANARFHEKRKILEEMMSDSEYRHQERVDQAGEELKKAEREVEEIAKKIEEIVHRPV